MNYFKTKKEILWDYKNPIDDVLWKLQRIILFFPSVGTDKKTIDLLYEKRDLIKMEEGKYILIGIYKELWDAKTKRKLKKK